ncbi:L-aminopeptidase/D-esterase-like protein [Tissierella praeacuta]|uniref:P1 family peptidase n=1 Tax=Tissierella praeacuta TaxID=43131 RepID=UPI00104B2C18|nr:P1 family peptidase [Tissierella praeacuta]TCU68878.1 L-aminopeptidase/D-esterase-like protein [Tissierella praeacuta]
MYQGYITDVPGIKVGHAQSEEGMTGCTVIICDSGATGGVDVRGSAPGTRETDLFKSEKMVDKVHAVVLSGGSAFGLEAASGVMRYLEEQNIGFDVGVTKVPIVASAVIFDLNIGNCKIRPDFNMGYIAAKNANVNNIQGNVGCGMGATIGKILGPENAMKSGLGSATIKVGELIVSAMVAVNSFGDIYDYKNNKQIAGVYDYKNNKLLNTIDIMKNKNRNLGFNIQNTTIGIIATNAKLTKAEANKISEMAHNGFARSINPIHTMVDGDTIFTMATNEIMADISLIGTMAGEAMSEAIVNGVLFAEGVCGLKALKDI